MWCSLSRKMPEIIFNFWTGFCSLRSSRTIPKKAEAHWLGFSRSKRHYCRLERVNQGSEPQAHLGFTVGSPWCCILIQNIILNTGLRLMGFWLIILYEFWCFVAILVYSILVPIGTVTCTYSWDILDACLFILVSFWNKTDAWWSWDVCKRAVSTWRESPKGNCGVDHSA